VPFSLVGFIARKSWTFQAIAAVCADPRVSRDGSLRGDGRRGSRAWLPGKDVRLTPWLGGCPH